MIPQNYYTKYAYTRCIWDRHVIEERSAYFDDAVEVRQIRNVGSRDAPRHVVGKY